ncbi:MAG: PGF-pre-PGF domain-containing protein, partial [Candidatus Aenigmatarchaeota archaeon]
LTNDFSSTDVALKRWASDDWQKLMTTKLSESSTDVEYESETPGFSTFVITAEKPSVVTPTPVCGNDILETGEQCDKNKMGGATCVSRGFAGGGDITCTSACTFNTTACTGIQGPYCGDGTCNNNETSTTCLEDCPSPTGGFGLSTEQLTIIAIIIILIIAGGAWYWFFRR